MATRQKTSSKNKNNNPPTSVSSLKSMTGYGKAESKVPNGKLQVEIRSVNHRYGEISVKMPRQLLFCENVIKKQVGERLKRGKVDIFVQFEASSGEVGKPQANIPLAKAYFDAFQSLRQALSLPDPVSLALIAAQRDVLVSSDENTLFNSLEKPLLEVVEAAVDALECMRTLEGNHLADDLYTRLMNLDSLIDALAQRAPLSVAAAEVRLRERLQLLLGDTELDPARLSQEVAILADRCDVTEELVRFSSHMNQVRETLLQHEPVGRKLDFLLQELNREVNTIGSKANNREITSLVVEMKAELEKIREQVQNLE